MFISQLTTSRMDIYQLLTIAETAVVNVERVITKAKEKQRQDIEDEGACLLERVFLNSASGEFKLIYLSDNYSRNEISKLEFKKVQIPLLNAIDVMMSYSEQHRYFRDHSLRPSEQ